MTNVYFNLNQMQHPCRRTMVGWTGTPSENREKIEPRECGLTHDYHGTISYAQPIHTPTQPWRESGARVAKYVAMIFAVLIMSIGQAWADPVTISANYKCAGSPVSIVTTPSTGDGTYFSAFAASSSGGTLATNADTLRINVDKSSSATLTYTFTAKQAIIVSGYKIYGTASSDKIKTATISYTGNLSGDSKTFSKGAKDLRSTYVDKSGFSTEVAKNGTFQIIISLSNADEKNARNLRMFKIELTVEASAAPVPVSTKRIYMDAEGWNTSSPKFYVHSWLDSDNNTEELVLADCEADVYYADIPATHTGLLFTRQDPSSTGIDWTPSGSGGKLWNQSVDITINTNDLFTFNGNWDVSGNSGFNAGTYSPTSYTISYAANGGGSSMSSETGICPSGSQTLTSNAFTAPTGCASFAHWTADVAVTANSVAVAAGDPIADGATLSSISSDIALTAVWKLAAPTITDNNDNTFSISGSIAGASYYYTTDGGTPTTSSSAYSSAVDFSAGEADITAKAIAHKDGYVDSDPASRGCVYHEPPVCAISDCGNATLTYAIKVGSSGSQATDGSDFITSATPSNSTALGASTTVGLSTITITDGTLKAAAATNACYDSKPNMTGKIDIYNGASYSSSNYLQFTFTVKEGYTFTPCDIQFVVQPVSNPASFRWEVTDGTNIYGYGTANNVAKGSDGGATVLTGITSPSLMEAGTYYIRLYPFYNGSGNTFRLGTDVILKGTTAAEACTAPSSVGISGTYAYLPGQTISLTATPTGGSGKATTYQWQKYYDDTWNDIDGATSAAFTKIDCGYGDSGNYRCVVSTGMACSTASDGYGVHVYSLNGGYEGDSWTAHDLTFQSGTTGQATVHLAAGKVYRFQVFSNNGKYYGNAWYSMKDISEWTFTDAAGDFRLLTGPEGDYTFTVDVENGMSASTVSVSVAYPSVSHPNESYVYIPQLWDHCYVHYWNNSDVAITAWGSDAEVTTTTTICGEDYFYMPAMVDYHKLIIKDAAGDPSNTTGDQVTDDHGGKYISHEGGWGWHDFATYTITFAGNGNTDGTMAVINGICPNSNQVLPANEYEKTDKAFQGWIADVAVKVGGETVTAGTLIDDEATIQDIASDITLTAQWCDPLNAPSGLQCSNQTRNSARLSWDGLGTSEDYEIKLESASGAGTFDWTACTENIYNATGLTRDAEYTFRVRRHQATGYCTDYSDVISVNFATTAAYGITNANPANGTITISAAEALEGATVDISAEPASGYQFSAWSIYKTGDAETTVSPAAATTSTSFTMPAYDVTVSATFVVQTYSVTYAGNGNTGGTVPTDDTGYTSGSTVTVKADVPTKTDYTFVGWLNSVDNTIYKAGQSFTITAATTLTALWTPSGSCINTLVNIDFTNKGSSTSYTAGNTYTLDGTSVYFKSAMSTYSDGTYLNLPGNATTSANYIAVPLADINGEITITVIHNNTRPQWKHYFNPLNSAATTSNLSTAPSSMSDNTRPGSNTTTSTWTISNISKSDGVFYIGKGSNGTSQLQGLTITSPCTTSGYTVTFDKGGQDDATGMPADIVGVPSGKKIATPLDPTLAGYTFNGWVTTSGGSTLFDFANTTITGNTTIYAKWIELPASTTPVLPSLSDTEECDADDFTTWDATPTNASAISAAGESVSYSWKNSSDVEVATTATYQAEEAGTYTVTVTVSKDGQKSTAVTSDELTATLNTAASKTAEPDKTVTAAAGESFTVSGLTATNATGYQWYSCNSTGGSKSELSGKTDATLTDTKAEVGVYYYICTIGNACGDDIDSRVVTVNVYTPIDPTLTYSSTTLYVEPEATTATPTVTGNTGSGTCTYSVTSASPAGCVTVDAETGVITAVSVGEATITVTIAASGDYAAGSATCDVNVAGCSYSEIARLIPTGASDGTLTSSVGATKVVAGLQAGSSSGWYKLGSKPSAFGINLTDGYQVGDSIIVRVTIGDVDPSTGTGSQASTPVRFFGDAGTTAIWTSTEAISAGKDTTIRFVVDATMAEAIASSKTIELYRTTNEASPRYSQNHQVYSMIVKRTSCTGNIAEFTGGGEDSNWDDDANWAGGKAPTSEDRVVITNNMTVNVTTAQAKEIILDQEAGGTLTINAGQALVVAGTIQKWNGSEFVPTTAADLAIGSSADGNATLIFENSNSAAATVQMYSIGSTDGWKWQYIGVPFDGANAQATYYGAYLYKWDNGWTAVQKSDDLEMFAGYCISYPAANYTYVMDGALAPTTEQSITVPAGKSMVVGNSWTAPIQITQFEDEDFSGLLKNVYLYNTGNDESQTASTTSSPTGDAIYAAGTYISVPIHSAEYTGVKVISSLQGFFVKDDDTQDGGGTLSLSYSKHVRPAVGNSVVNGAMHAPKRVADETDRPAVLKMKVSGSQYDDRLILLEREDFTTGYDAGWDGDKMGDVATSPRITTTREDGTADAVAALPDLEGTLINFRAASTDDSYTLYFDYETEDAEPLYLLDLVTNTYTRVETGGSYTFVTTDKADHKRFALTRYRAPQITTDVEDALEDSGQGKAVKFIENDKLYILRNGVLYDGTGKRAK